MSDPVQIPLSPDVPLYTQRVSLDGVDFVLRFDWNAKQGRFYLSVYEADGVTAIRRGLKVVANWAPLRVVTANENRPAGTLYFMDATNFDGEAPGFSELGDGRRVVLIYHPAP